jgi:hypothetical protein
MLFESVTRHSNTRYLTLQNDFEIHLQPKISFWIHPIIVSHRLLVYRQKQVYPCADYPLVFKLKPVY